MKEEKVSIKRRREEPQPTVEERETRAVLVAVIRDSQNHDTAMEYLDELEFLAETANIRAVKRFTQRLPQPLSKIYVGPGKLEEIALWCKENEIDVAIFDDELSPAQTRNIEQAMPCRIMDRTRLILDIFMSRAQTAYAKTQVELAQHEYMLPAWQVSGHTLSVSAVAQERVVVPVSVRSRPTAVSCVTAYRNLRRTSRR